MTDPTPHKVRGLEAFRADDLAAAEAAFVEAARLYAAEGRAADAAEMQNNLSVVRLAQSDAAGALAAVAGTPKVFAAAGDRLRQAQALMNEAKAHEGLEHLEQATRGYEQAIELFAAVGDTEHRAACWKALSGVQVKQKKNLQAMASMQAGLSLSAELTAKEKTLKTMLDRAMSMIQGR